MQEGLRDVSAQWIYLQTDNYRATLPVDSLLLYDGSHLSNMVAMAVQCKHDCIRLNCSADVAREVVSVIRLGDAYTQPKDPRLLRALSHQLDFLGVRLPQPKTSSLLYLSSFHAGDIQDFRQEGASGSRQKVWDDVNHLYVYDSEGPLRGWAELEKDEWPEEMMKWCNVERRDGSWLSATMPYEYTSAGRCTGRIYDGTRPLLITAFQKQTEHMQGCKPGETEVLGWRCLLFKYTCSHQRQTGPAAPFEGPTWTWKHQVMRTNVFFANFHIQGCPLCGARSPRWL